MTREKGGLGIHWLVLALSCFLTFVPLYSLYLVHADVPLIVGFGLVFSAYVATLSTAFLWWSGRAEFTYVEPGLASAFAVLAFAVWLVSSGTLEDLWSISILLLLFIFLIAGMAAKWLYDMLLNQAEELIRR
jgi:hypothetical protein